MRKGETISTYNKLETARRRYLSQNRSPSLIDLANSRFERAGISLPEKIYRMAWDYWRAHAIYHPDGRGSIGTREVIAEYLAGQSKIVDPQNIILTAGSSISYQLLFTFLRDRGPDRDQGWNRDASSPTIAVKNAPSRQGRFVALPLPGYPLFEDIAHNSGLETRVYTTLSERGFLPDPGEIESLIHEGAVAVVVVSPSNPCGVIVPPETMRDIDRVCAQHNVLLIVDEVFERFSYDDVYWKQVPAKQPEALTVYLNGLSKACAAPEIKLGWAAVVGGSERKRAELVEALDTYHDTYLTVSGFAEAAATVFLGTADGRSGMDDIQRNVRRLQQVFESSIGTIAALEDMRPIHGRGGIHRIIRVDPVAASHRFGSVDDEEIAVALLENSGLLVHPGYLYGLDDSRFGGGPWIVVTSLNSEETLSEAARRLYDVFR